MIFQKVLPPIWFVLATAMMWCLHHWLPIQQLFSPPVTYLGAVAIAKGIGIVLFCAYLFRQKKTAIKPFQESSYLLQEGIYNFSRNPIYLGMIGVLIGWWIFLGSLSPVFIVPIFALLIQEKFIKREEEMLAETFGEDYQQYKATVRRWL